MGRVEKHLSYFSLVLSVTLPAATSRRLLNLPQAPTIWVGGSCAFFTDDAEAYCGAWLDADNHTIRNMEVSEQPFSKQQLTRLLVQAMEHPQAKHAPCRPQAIVVDDLELQFFLRGILLPLEIEVRYSKEIPLLEEFFAFMESELLDEEEEEDSLPPEYAPLFLPKVKALAQLDLWRYLCNMQPLKLHCESWECPTLIALFLNHQDEDQDLGVMLYRGEEAFWQFWQQAMTEPDIDEDTVDDETYEDPNLLDQDCLLLNIEVADPFEDVKDVLFEMKGQSYTFNVGVVHPLEGIRHFVAPEEAEMLYVVIDALIRFWRRHGKKFRQNTYPDVQLSVTIPSPLHSALSYEVQVSTVPEMLSQMHSDMAAKEQAEHSLNTTPIHITPIGVELDTSFLLETQPFLGQLRQAVRDYQAGEVPAGVEHYPLVILQAKASDARALAANVANEGGVHHLTLVSDPKGVLGALLVLQTNANHLWLCEMLDLDAMEELEEWFKAVAAAEGACGLVIASSRSGKSRRKPRLNQMIGLYEVFLQPNYIDRDRPPTPQPIEHRP